MTGNRFAMLLAGLLIAAVTGSSAIQSGARAVTFSEDVAPILYANCVSCHRPGEAAPFSLISYEDVSKRAKNIAKVTQARQMPPWHAAHGYGEFADERGLSDAQIATIREWVAAGMPRGKAGKMPALPKFTDGWQLGTPDLVLEMPEAFPVPAGGPDVYRNFVLPTGLAEDKWVRAVEFRPGTRTVVHHALFHYIRGGSAAKVVSSDGRPGFGGAMPAGFIPAFAPAGEIGVWAVGATPHALPDGLATPLPKGSDVVLQLHLHPSGKPETERAKIGIYFAAAAPVRRIRELGVLGFFGLLANIDIPPGEKNYTIKGSLTVPADMLVLSVMAHAHYLGKEFKATATLPDGSTRPMLWIQDWDFNWQDRYFYKQPVALPKGTRIDVTIAYDNSADNPHNPCTPPRRVQWGLQSTDEMGGVRFQMVTASDVAEADMEKAAAGIRAAVAKLAQSEAAQDAIKKAAERNREMEERFRQAAGQTQAVCGDR
jgi:mono/diheme cytochrome c family protein